MHYRDPGAHCRSKTDAPDLLKTQIGQIPINIDHHFVAKGCEKCYYTGYRGRTAVYEVIPIDQQLAANIRDKQLDISDYFAQSDVMTLKDAALKLFLEGRTSWEEACPTFCSAD